MAVKFYTEATPDFSYTGDIQLSTLYLDWPKQLTQCVKQYLVLLLQQAVWRWEDDAAEMKTQTWNLVTSVL